MKKNTINVDHFRTGNPWSSIAMSTRGYRFSTNQSMMATIDHSICLKIFTFYFGIIFWSCAEMRMKYVFHRNSQPSLDTQQTCNKPARGLPPMKAFSSQSGDSWTKFASLPGDSPPILHGLLRLLRRVFSRFQDVSSGWSFQIDVPDFFMDNEEIPFKMCIFQLGFPHYKTELSHQTFAFSP
jgi:hypothetical protein